jgi:hypothetical protein
VQVASAVSASFIVVELIARTICHREKRSKMLSSFAKSCVCRDAVLVLPGTAMNAVLLNMAVSVTTATHDVLMSQNSTTHKQAQFEKVQLEQMIATM